jgi:hypothetical protein
MIRRLTDVQRFFSALLSQTFSPASKYDLSRMTKLPASYKVVSACGGTSQTFLFGSG